MIENLDHRFCYDIGFTQDFILDNRKISLGIRPLRLGLPLLILASK